MKIYIGGLDSLNKDRLRQIFTGSEKREKANLLVSFFYTKDLERIKVLTKKEKIDES